MDSFVITAVVFLIVGIAIGRLTSLVDHAHAPTPSRLREVWQPAQNAPGADPLEPPMGNPSPRSEIPTATPRLDHIVSGVVVSREPPSPFYGIEPGSVKAATIEERDPKPAPTNPPADLQPPTFSEAFGAVWRVIAIWWAERFL